jgi:hypothetical protein
MVKKAKRRRQKHQNVSQKFLIELLIVGISEYENPRENNEF